ncbi:MAG: hypothetical protein DI538_15850 [Azospira oryzae]|nr:MAG: hypothetical protein DI538_15850 [Azospira oryzae]
MQKWGKVDSRIEALIKEVEIALTPTTLSEKILAFMNRANTRLQEGYTQTLERIQEQSAKLMGENDASTIASSVSQVRKILTNQREYFWPVNQGLFRHHPHKAMEVYEELFSADRDYIYGYGGGFLWALRFEHKKKDSYWSKIHELEKEGKSESVRTILNVYNSLKKPLESKDSDLIDRLVEVHQKKPELALSLLMALHALITAGYDKKLIYSLFDICPQSAADSYLLHNQSAEPLFLKELLLHHSLRFDVSSSFQSAFSLLVQNKVISEDELFKYFEKRFDLQCKLYEENNYDIYLFVPHEKNNPFALTDEDRIHLFQRALRWYMSGKWQKQMDYRATDLHEFLQPSTEIMHELINVYHIELSSITNPLLLQRLLSTLNVFEKNKIICRVSSRAS